MSTVTIRARWESEHTFEFDTAELVDFEALY